jgi:hypothetical protein
VPPTSTATATSRWRSVQVRIPEGDR